ncbi:hypothetical protein ES708_06402 [subsurface metagenome]
MEATGSTAPAKTGLYPILFIKGIVKLPVVTVLAVELPDTVPIIPLETTAAFAGPPLVYPVRAVAKSIKNLPAPVLFNIAPNKIKR